MKTSILVLLLYTTFEVYTKYGIGSLTSVGELRSVTEIGNYAFANCSNLTLRVLPNSYAEDYAKSNSIPYTYIED